MSRESNKGIIESKNDETKSSRKESDHKDIKIEKYNNIADNANKDTKQNKTIKPQWNTKDYIKEYRQKNREKHNASARKTQHKYRERYYKYQKEYKRKNRERENNRQREYRKTNIIKVKECCREYYIKNRQKYNEYQKEYYTTHSNVLNFFIFIINKIIIKLIIPTFNFILNLSSQSTIILLFLIKIFGM